MDFFDEDQLDDGPRYGPDSTMNFDLMRASIDKAESDYRSMVEHDEAADALNDDAKSEPLYVAAETAGQSCLTALDELDRLSQQTRTLLTPKELTPPSPEADWSDRVDAEERDGWARE